MIRPTDRKLLQALRMHEGFRSKPYTDTTGNLTVGYGTNLTAGITREQGEALLKLHVKHSAEWLSGRYAWFDGLTDDRQRALLEMLYQLGPGSFVRFRRMLRALRGKQYAKAAHEMIDSRWSVQTPKRARWCAKLMVEG